MLPGKLRRAFRRYRDSAEVPSWLRHLVYRLRKIPVPLLRALAPVSWARLGPPRSIVSLHELLRKPGTSQVGEVILDGQKVNPTKAGSLTAICRDDQSLHQPSPILWSYHRNARLVGRTLGLVLPGKKFVAESTFHRAIPFEPALNTVWLPRPKYLKGNYTSIISLGIRNNTVPNYSHWLTDALARLALLPRFPPDTVVLVPVNLAEYQKHTLELLGLKGRYRFTPEEHLIVENYYFSSTITLMMRENPYALQFLRQTFLPKADRNFNGPKRFVIERKGTRGIANETEFNEFFRNLGWPVIDPASLSFEEEIQLFNQAEAFTGAIGSGFTNAIWSQPGCAVIQIIPENFMEASTEWICEHNQLRWRFLIFPATRDKKVKVDLDVLHQTLRDLSLA